MQPWESCSQKCASATKEYKLVPAQAGEASDHTSHASQTHGLSTYGVNSLRQADEHLSYVLAISMPKGTLQ